MNQLQKIMLLAWSMFTTNVLACDAEYRLDDARTRLLVAIKYQDTTKEDTEKIYAELRALRLQIEACGCSECKEEKKLLSEPGWFTGRRFPKSKRTFNAARDMIYWDQAPWDNKISPKAVEVETPTMTVSVMAYVQSWINYITK